MQVLTISLFYASALAICVIAAVRLRKLRTVSDALNIVDSDAYRIVRFATWAILFMIISLGAVHLHVEVSSDAVQFQALRFLVYGLFMIELVELVHRPLASNASIAQMYARSRVSVALATLYVLMLQALIIVAQTMFMRADVYPRASDWVSTIIDVLLVTGIVALFILTAARLMYRELVHATQYSNE